MAHNENRGTDSFEKPSLLKRVIKVSIIAVFVTGSLTILEEITGISLFKKLLADFQEMKLITAILLVFSTAALWPYYRQNSLRHRLLRIAGVIILSVSLLTLISFSLEYEPAERNFLKFIFFTQAANRMALFTSLIFLLLAVIFILFSNNSHKHDNIAHIVFFPAACLSYFVIISYVLDVSDLFSLKGITTAPDTAFCLFLLCLVILFLKPDTWLMRILSGTGNGSKMGRRILPWLLVLPVVISWLRIRTDHLGYSSEAGAILAAIAYTLSFLFLVWWNAYYINRLDYKRQIAYEALRESESRLNALIAATSDVVYRMSPDWAQMYTLKGGSFLNSVEEPVDDWINSFIPVDAQPVVKDAIKQAIDRKGKFELEHQVISIDSSIGWTHSRAVPILKQNGEIEEWMGIAEDITRKVQAEEMLRVKERNDALREGAEKSMLKLNEELMRSNLELQQFVYLTSHDLQEPLRLIITFTEQLSENYKEHFDEEGEKIMGYLISNSLRLKSLINDLFTYSMIGSGTSPFADVDFNQLYSRVVTYLTPDITEKKAIVTCDSLPVVSGDEDQLFHLLHNLLDNSLKFSIKAPVIHVSAEEKPDSFLFSVSDNGIGIDLRYAEKIFLIFQRLVTRNEYKGTGIGLAICKRIVENHGGKIFVESIVNEGSTFFFTIPKKDETALKTEN